MALPNQTDVRKVVQDEDDFGFEMRTAKIFGSQSIENNFYNQPHIGKLEHGGTYTDSVTGKSRQFDFRCEILSDVPGPSSVEPLRRALLAVECKNLHPSSPLVVCGRPRKRKEAYYVFVESTRRSGSPTSELKKALGDWFYQEGSFVGKSLLRLKLNKNNQWESDSNNDVYDRWAQALASSVDLVRRAYLHPAPPFQFDSISSLVLPIVVVPNDLLWKVSFDDSGSISEDPQVVDSCEYFVENQLEQGPWFIFTHIHFVTLRGLDTLLGKFWRPHMWDRLFPADAMKITQFSQHS